MTPTTCASSGGGLRGAMRIGLWLAVGLIVLFWGSRLSSQFYSNIGWVNLNRGTERDMDAALFFWFPQALASNESSVSAHMGIGVGMILHGDPQQAVSHLDHPAVMLQRREMALFWAGEAQLRLGQAGRAAQFWRTLAGEDAGLQILLSQRLIKAGQIDQAVDSLKSVLATGTFSRGERIRLYLMLSELNQWRKPSEALFYSQAAVVADPQSGDAYGHLAWALYQLQRDEESVQASRTALRLGLSGRGTYQTWNGTYEILGRALLNMGSCQESRVALEESVARRPAILWPQIALGQAYQCLGDYRAAAKQFQIALEIAPEQQDAGAGLRQAMGQLQ